MRSCQILFINSKKYVTFSALNSYIWQDTNFGRIETRSDKLTHPNLSGDMLWLAESTSSCVTCSDWLNLPAPVWHALIGWIHQFLHGLAMLSYQECHIAATRTNHINILKICYDIFTVLSTCVTGPADDIWPGHISEQLTVESTNQIASILNVSLGVYRININLTDNCRFIWIQRIKY